MAKPKNSPEQKAPAPGPAPSAEEVRRLHIETAAKDRLKVEATNLVDLLKGNLKKADSQRALEQVGVKILEIALQTRGRLRSSDGRGDAFLEATAANVRTALRHADKIMEGHDREMTAWGEALEIAGPALEDLKRISKGLERPGVKVAIVPGGGDGLFDDEGQPTEKAVAPAAPAPAPKPPAAEEKKPAAPAPSAQVAAREIPTLGMGPVIDVDVVEPTHPLDGVSIPDAEAMVQELLAQFEEAGVEDDLKRKDWKAAEKAWIATWPEECELAVTKCMFDRLTLALKRSPMSWAVITEKDLLDHQRQQAMAVPDPAYDLGKEA